MSTHTRVDPARVCEKRARVVFLLLQALWFPLSEPSLSATTLVFFPHHTRFCRLPSTPRLARKSPSRTPAAMQVPSACGGLVGRALAQFTHNTPHKQVNKTHSHRTTPRHHPAASCVPVPHPCGLGELCAHPAGQEPPSGVRRQRRGRPPGGSRVLGYRPRRVPYPACAGLGNLALRPGSLVCCFRAPA